MKGQVFTSDLLGAVLLMTVILGFYLQAIQFTQNTLEEPEALSPALLSQGLLNLRERAVLNNTSFSKQAFACVSNSENAYCLALDPHLTDTANPGDSFSHPGSSVSVLLEDGRPLGPNHASLATIRQQGNGAFSDRNDPSAGGTFLMMSTSDNSDPRTNGRRYELIYLRTPAFDAPPFCAQIFTADRLISDGCAGIDLSPCDGVKTATRIFPCGNDACLVRVNVCQSGFKFKQVT